MNILGIIPARYDSTRFPGKPLLNIFGQTMIERVYRQCEKSDVFAAIFVATDSDLIEQECKSKNIPCLKTSSKPKNGTERCAEALLELPDGYDLVVNIQGDEPFVSPDCFGELADIFTQNPQAEIGTLYHQIKDSNEIHNPSIIKIVKDQNQKALYFSRNAVPYLRDIPREHWLEHHTFFKHIGIYAFRSEILNLLVNLPESTLEKAENLEQLRWLENGYEIYLNETFSESKSIDTPEDYEYVLSSNQ